ncbi:hypothetical protein SA58113_1848 [Staphylococcus argenteus]|nr:hypothetical protein SA58113_1848 [Staphylococcus argenteus]CCE59560.1 conserved hypothetical protein [Staphylococcus argenteus]
MKKKIKIKGVNFFMNEQQTIEQIKARLNKFIEDIDHVNPDEVRVEDIDEWIGLLDQLEEKVKLVSK